MSLHHHTTVLDRPRAMARDSIFTRDVELSFFNLFWIYTIASVVGLVLETVVSAPIDGEWRNRYGLVWGPFSPIYGVGAVLMTLFLHRLRHRNWLLVFLAAALLGGTFEWCAGTVWQDAFGFVAWSYQDQPLNIQGKTCLGIAVVWGILGVLWIKVLMPVTVRVAELIPERARTTVTAACFAFAVVDAVVTVSAFGFWFGRQVGMPVDTPLRQFFATWFGDEFMSTRFELMSMHPELAIR